jgi:hypothetical protein
MKKINSYIIVSLIFGSIPILFGTRITGLITGLDNDVIRGLLTLSRYLLTSLFMLLPTGAIFVILLRKEPEDRKQALNILLRFIISHFVTIILFLVIGSLIIFSGIVGKLVLPPGGYYSFGVLPFLVVRFSSNAQNVLVVYGLPLGLSVLMAACFYLIYRLFLGEVYRRRVVRYGLFLRFVLSSAILGILDTVLQKYFGVNAILSFSESVIYVGIFLVLGIIWKRSKKQIDAAQTNSIEKGQG